VSLLSLTSPSTLRVRTARDRAVGLSETEGQLESASTSSFLQRLKPLLAFPLRPAL
jgi:hypothetical protein